MSSHALRTAALFATLVGGLSALGAVAKAQISIVGPDKTGLACLPILTTPCTRDADCMGDGVQCVGGGTAAQCLDLQRVVLCCGVDSDCPARIDGVAGECEPVARLGRNVCVYGALGSCLATNLPTCFLDATGRTTDLANGDCDADLVTNQDDACPCEIGPRDDAGCPRDVVPDGGTDAGTTGRDGGSGPIDAGAGGGRDGGAGRMDGGGGGGPAGSSGLAEFRGGGGCTCEGGAGASAGARGLGVLLVLVAGATVRRRRRER